MTDASMERAVSRPRGSLKEADDRTRRRRAAEKRFRFYGMAAIGAKASAVVSVDARSGPKSFFKE